MQRVFVAAALAASLVLSTASTVWAGQVTVKTSGGDRSYSSAAASSSQAVPPNCIRQECGKLWCWQVKGQGR